MPRPASRAVPNTLEIVRYMHCALCLAELPAGESPASFARLSVGFTKLGVQVWCARHEANVMHVDFEGACHPANTKRATAETTPVSAGT